MENLQTIIRFKKLEPNLNNHFVEQGSESQGKKKTFLIYSGRWSIMGNGTVLAKTE
jgi:hypothetical protein